MAREESNPLGPHLVYPGCLARPTSPCPRFAQAINSGGHLAIPLRCAANGSQAYGPRRLAQSYLQSQAAESYLWLASTFSVEGRGTEACA